MSLLQHVRSKEGVIAIVAAMVAGVLAGLCMFGNTLFGFWLNHADTHHAAYPDHSSVRKAATSAPSTHRTASPSATPSQHVLPSSGAPETPLDPQSGAGSPLHPSDAPSRRPGSPSPPLPPSVPPSGESGEQTYEVVLTPGPKAGKYSNGMLPTSFQISKLVNGQEVPSTCQAYVRVEEKKSGKVVMPPTLATCDSEQDFTFTESLSPDDYLIIVDFVNPSDAASVMQPFTLV